MLYKQSFQSHLLPSRSSSAGGLSWGGWRVESALGLVASVVCGSALAGGTSICGAAVCVQLIGWRTMAGCRWTERSVCMRWLHCAEQRKHTMQKTGTDKQNPEKTAVPLWGAGLMEVECLWPVTWVLMLSEAFLHTEIQSPTHQRKLRHIQENPTGKDPTKPNTYHMRTSVTRGVLFYIFGRVSDFYSL